MKYLLITSFILVFSCSDSTSENEQSDQDKMNQAKSALSSKNYENAAKNFEDIVLNADEKFYEEASLGLAFSQIKIKDYQKAYSSLQAGMNNPDKVYTRDYVILFCLLEYAHLERYNDAIIRGEQLLNENASFIMHFDSNLNEKDIRLTVAIAYYKLGDFDSALSHAKLLDSGISLIKEDDNYEYLLADHLNRLSNLYL